MEIWYINLRKSLEIQTSMIFSNVNRFKIAGNTLDIMRQTACLVFNPIMVEGYAALFSCTAVVQASDSMTAVKSLPALIYSSDYILLLVP